MSLSGAWEAGVELAQARAIGDGRAVKQLLDEVEDWRYPAIWLAQALGQAIALSGRDPVATLAEYAQVRGNRRSVLTFGARLGVRAT